MLKRQPRVSRILLNLDTPERRMTPSRTRHRSRSLSLVALLVAANVLACAATAQAQGLGGPRIAEFDPSPDHWAALDNNEPTVSRYEFSLYLLGVSEPVQTVDMGKPWPDADGRIRYDLSQVATWSLSPGVYQARVSAIGPHGTAPSEPSDPFTLEANLSACIFSLSATTLSAPASGGGYAVDVLTGDGCGWAVTTEVPWVRLRTGGGSGSGKAAFDVRANTSPSSRTATIEMGGRASRSGRMVRSCPCSRGRRPPRLRRAHHSARFSSTPLRMCQAPSSTGPKLAPCSPPGPIR